MQWKLYDDQGIANKSTGFHGRSVALVEVSQHAFSASAGAIFSANSWNFSENFAKGGKNQLFSAFFQLSYNFSLAEISAFSFFF